MSAFHPYMNIAIIIKLAAGMRYRRHTLKRVGLTHERIIIQSHASGYMVGHLESLVHVHGVSKRSPFLSLFRTFSQQVKTEQAPK